MGRAVRIVLRVGLIFRRFAGTTSVSALMMVWWFGGKKLSNTDSYQK